MERIVVYYDSWCPVCTGVKRRLERVDWLGRLHFASTREPGVAESLGVTDRALEQRMHIRFAQSGHVVDGIHAIGAIAARVPTLMPAWPVVKIASWLGFGQPLYDWVASRRRIVPVGHCESGACTIKGDRP